MQPKTCLCLLLSSTIATLLGCATQAPPPPLLSTGQRQEAIDHLSRFINHEMQQALAQGLSIAIVSDQTIVWEQGFGWANKEMQRPASAQTLYRTGSISKLLTDLGALQLAA
jgi:CubicO group peptidase (beta-lactamase class C family)